MHLSVNVKEEGRVEEMEGREKEKGREERLYSPYSVSTYRGLLSVDTGV